MPSNTGPDMGTFLGRERDGGAFSVWWCEWVYIWGKRRGKQGFWVESVSGERLPEVEGGALGWNAKRIVRQVNGAARVKPRV